MRHLNLSEDEEGLKVVLKKEITAEENKYGSLKEYTVEYECEKLKDDMDEHTE